MNVSSKLCRLCKMIKAAKWLVVPSTVDGCCLLLAIMTLVLQRLTLACYHIAAYISLRCKSPGCRIFDQARCQSRTSQGARSPQPAPAAGPRALVSGRSLLRCTRPSPSEVRDASSGQHRGGKEGRCGRAFWCFPPDVLSSRSGVCAARARRVVTAAAWPPKSPQAYARSDGVYRYTLEWRTSSQCSRTLSGDPGRTGPVGPPPQYRTRPGAQKKTVEINPPPSIPSSMVAMYEQLRADVLLGRARPEGLGAVIFHGLVDGVASLCSSTDCGAVRVQRPSTPRPSVCDHELLRLLTNMVLQTQSEVMHVY